MPYKRNVMFGYLSKFVMEIDVNMDKTEIPFWEEAYQKDDVMAFSIEPNKTIKEFEHLFKKEFDISESGISKLKKLCEISCVDINAFVQDLTTYNFKKKYDLIMSFATLCFVEKNDWKRFVNKAKDNTNVGGIHIMHIFTDVVPASIDIAPFAIGLAHEGEIKEMYSDWEILQFQSYVFEDEHPNVPKHFHAVNKIVTRKVDQ